MSTVRGDDEAGVKGGVGHAGFETEKCEDGEELRGNICSLQFGMGRWLIGNTRRNRR